MILVPYNIQSIDYKEEVNRQTDKQTDSQTDRQTDGPKGLRARGSTGPLVQEPTGPCRNHGPRGHMPTGA